MAGRWGGRGGGTGEGRDEQRLRDRERRAKARAADAEQAAAAEAARRAARSAPDEFEFDPLPAYAAPSTRAGRDRHAQFAPAAPAVPREATPVEEPTPSGRAGQERRTATTAAGGGAAAGSGRRPATAPGGGGPRPPIDGAAILGWLRTPRGAGLAGMAGLALLVGVVIGSGGDDQGKATTKASADAPVAQKKSPYGTPTKASLPPASRVVAFTGAPQADELGILGTMPFEQAADRLDRQSVPYDRKTRPVARAFDLIATIADAHPGPAGKYRTRQTSKVIARYLRAARRHDAALILDVQPGTSNFVDELRPLERWLKEPDVHLALDPEWRMRPGVQPGTEIGWVSAGEVTATLARVARIIRANDLPPKLVLVHRFTDGMIRDLATVEVPKEIVGVISIDGVGTKPLKESTYDRIAPTLPKPWLPGFKLFYKEDAEAGGLMSGKQVMALKPRPHVVLYE